MNYNDVSKSVRRIAKKTLTQDDLEQQIIIQKGKTYQAFGSYLIEETQFGWQVTSDLFADPMLFNTAKVALAWCIAHKVKQYKLAAMLSHLDARVTEKQFDVDMLTNRLDNTVIDEADRAILMARLMEDINSRQMFKKQLAKCLKQAKYIKLIRNNLNEPSRLNKNSRRRNSR